jgi:hypothetical protein
MAYSLVRNSIIPAVGVVVVFGSDSVELTVAEIKDQWLPATNVYIKHQLR